MSPVEPYVVDQDGKRTSVNTNLSDEGSSGRTIVQVLSVPIVLAAAEPGVPRHLRLEWKGEVWPRFVMNAVGLSNQYVLTTQTLGNAMQLSVERLQPAAQS
jgi:hypothetical protein